MTRIDSSWVNDKMKRYISVFYTKNGVVVVRRELVKTYKMKFETEVEAYKMLNKRGYKIYQSFYRIN